MSYLKMAYFGFLKWSFLSKHNVVIELNMEKIHL
jgi:hypothetical protein